MMIDDDVNIFDIDEDESDGLVVPMIITLIFTVVDDDVHNDDDHGEVFHAYSVECMCTSHNQ